MREHSESRPKGYKKFAKEGFPRQLFFANAYQFIIADMAGKDLLKDRKKISFEIEVDAPECRWIAPIRAKPEKIYISQSSDYSAEGNHVPIILNKMLGKNTEKNESKMLKAINEFGKSSGLFDAVRVKRFGKEASSPFQVNVDLGGTSLWFPMLVMGFHRFCQLCLRLAEDLQLVTYLYSSRKCICTLRPKLH